jgi:hypothetical protein
VTASALQLHITHVGGSPYLLAVFPCALTLADACCCVAVAAAAWLAVPIPLPVHYCSWYTYKLLVYMHEVRRSEECKCSVTTTAAACTTLQLV